MQLPDTAHFGGSITEPEFQAAMRLMLGKQPNGRSMLVSALFFSLFAVAMGITLGKFAAAVIVFAFVLPSANAWWNQSPTRLRRLMASNESLQSHVTGRFDQQEFIYGVNRVPWPAVTKVDQDTVVALIHAPAAFIVPRSFFAANEDWSTFLRLATEAIPVSNGGPVLQVVKTALLWCVIIAVIVILWSYFGRA
jgi:hypothetical protein